MTTMAGHMLVIALIPLNMLEIVSIFRQYPSYSKKYIMWPGHLIVPTIRWSFIDISSQIHYHDSCQDNEFGMICQWMNSILARNVSIGACMRHRLNSLLGNKGQLPWYPGECYLQEIWFRCSVLNLSDLVYIMLVKLITVNVFIMMTKEMSDLAWCAWPCMVSTAFIFPA